MSIKNERNSSSDKMISDTAQAVAQLSAQVAVMNAKIDAIEQVLIENSMTSSEQFNALLLEKFTANFNQEFKNHQSPIHTLCGLSERPSK